MKRVEHTRDNARVMPHSLEAERAVLGAILLSAQAHSVAAAIVDARDFFRHAHQVLFAACGRLVARAVAPDLVTLRDELSATQLDEVGGPAYIASLVDGMPRSTNVEHHAAIIAEHARLRAVIIEARKAETLAYEGQTHASALIESTRENLDTIGRGGYGSRAKRHLQLTRASAIRIRPVRWLWESRAPLGSLVLIGGREGIGKSVLSATLAADITRGRLPGTFMGNPRAVIIAATEDSWEFTIVPRLMAAGADLDLVHRVDVVTSDAFETGLSLPRDLGELDACIAETGAVLVIFDPLMSRLDIGLDSHKDSEVRQALEPLAAIADRTGATFAGLIHVNKSASNDALTTLMGSRAFAAVARSVLFVMVDPDAENTRLLGVPKNNLGRSDLPTLTFAIGGYKVADTLEGPVWTGKLLWTGETERSIRDALETAAELGTNKTATTEASGWLTDYLTKQGGSADCHQILQEADKAAHSKNAMYRAKKRLGITSNTSGFPRRAFWTLTSQCSQSAGETSTTGKNGNTGNTGASVFPVGPVDPVGATLPDVGNTAREEDDDDAVRL